MKIAVIIPILHSPKQQLYQMAVKSLAISWQKAKRPKKDILEVILVFNNFPPESAKPKLPSYKIKTTIITNALNRGFTGAVNDGVWLAVFRQKADWCLVINDDATVEKNFFLTMLPELKSSRAVVSCGVKNPNGSLQSAGLRYFRSGLTEPLTAFLQTPYFAGTIFFVSSAAARWSFKEFGWLLAEFFFAYAEDLELSIRLLRQGKKVFIFPQALAVHLGSVTAKRGSAFQLYWGYRNLLFTMLMHWSWPRIFLSLPSLFFGQLYILGMLFLKRHWLIYPKILWSLWKNLILLRLYRKNFYEKLTYPYSL